MVMVLRSPAWKHVLSVQVGRPAETGRKRSLTRQTPAKTCTRFSSAAAGPTAAAATPPERRRAASRRRQPSGAGGKAIDLTPFYQSISHNEQQKRSQERDFLVSVLSSSPTKRDAKKYLQTFGNDHVADRETHRETPREKPREAQLRTPAHQIRAVRRSPQFVQGPRETQTRADRAAADQPHVAIVELQDPDSLDDATLGHLAKTFVQLRALGLLSVIVIGRTSPQGHAAHGWLDYVTHETLRVAAAIDQYGGRVTSLVDSAVALDDRVAAQNPTGSPFLPGRLYIDRADETLMRPLRNGNIVVVPPYAVSNECQARPVSTDDIVLALTRYFAGMQQRQPDSPDRPDSSDAPAAPAVATASVDRIIIIDPIGGTPSPRRPNGAHVFLNLEEEYRQAMADLDRMALHVPQTGGRVSLAATLTPRDVALRHKANLDIARHALALLPSSSSALLTTPAEAANLVAPERDGAADDASGFGYVGSVGTRRSQNPLIHNLLTDRPVYSSSLPLGRIKPREQQAVAATATAATAATTENVLDAAPPRMAQTTLIKRGMPLTIFPDPRQAPWTPPVPGGPRLRLTDTCIDLPRLVHLINDSFNRTLDVDDYLARVESSLAGVIIAGEYEGGAILTWERPAGLDEETAYRTGRLVPYLDKFAVRKTSQGAGGVADIVFTSMVRDCLPDGVCWRSRKDNPVNRWYFERSRGSWKLPGVNWTMFWTSPWAAVGEQGIWDYQSVCRAIEPSWADHKTRLD